MSQPVKIAVFVSGGGTNLQALIDAERSGKIPSGKITLVVSSSKEAYALKRAESAGIKAIAIERKGNPSFESQLIAAMEDNGIELIVLAGFLCILSADFTNRYPQRIINIHPSLIPSFCGSGYYGLRVHKAALAYGVKLTGATVHYVNEIPDGGRIIMQAGVEVKDGDTAETLQRRVMEQAEWKLLPAATELVCKKLRQES